MATPSTRLRRPALSRPRLLPVTIVAMSALLAVKSIVLVQAAAEEAIAPARAEESRPGPAHDAGSPGAMAMAASGGMTALTPSAEGGAQPTALQAVPSPPMTAPAPPVSEAERAILLDLRHRREVLDARVRDLDQREGELGAADRRLGERVQQLAALQARLESLESGRQQHSAENWAGLVKVYETMKPREAAAIFDVLDMQVLLQVLDRMQERRAAPVLAAMQPDRARLVTQMLAEMRTRAVTLPQALPSSTVPKS